MDGRIIPAAAGLFLATLGVGHAVRVGIAVGPAEMRGSAVGIRVASRTRARPEVANDRPIRTVEVMQTHQRHRAIMRWEGLVVVPAARVVIVVRYAGGG